MYLYEKKKKAVNLNRHTCINCKSKRYEDELIKLNVDGSGYAWKCKYDYVCQRRKRLKK